MTYLIVILLTFTLTFSRPLQTISSSPLLGLSDPRKINYPVRFTYIDKLFQWWPPTKVAEGMGVPGYAANHTYNYIAFAFWTHGQGAVDVGLVWSDPLRFFSTDNPFGSTKDGIQKFLKAKYNQAGINILISAFGATENPTTGGVDPIECANKLGKFVLQNNLDGVDIDWQDNAAMENGKGQQWLIKFTIELRRLLPSHLITHAPQAPYFCHEHYRNHGYSAINAEVGTLIDFYNVQFYNQVQSTYDTYSSLFVSALSPWPGSSVKEIMARNVPSNKIVIGKPVTRSDASNTGWVDKSVLAGLLDQGLTNLKWYAGVMFWQYSSDQSGEVVQTVIAPIKQYCEQHKKKCV